jgi:hypothetical protein
MSGVSSPDWSIKYAVVSNVPYKRSWCTVEPCLPCPYGIMWSRDLSPSTQGTCPPPPSQATEDSVYLQLPRRMNLDSVHSRVAHSRTCGYGTVYVNIVLYFSSSNTISWNIPLPNGLSTLSWLLLFFRFDSPHHRIKSFRVRSSHFPGPCRKHLLLLDVPTTGGGSPGGEGVGAGRT